MHVVTSALSLARELYRYGEAELADRAFALEPEAVARIGSRMGTIHRSGEAERLWPDGPRNKAYLLAVIEDLEGSARPCKRTRRLPEKSLPTHLQATEEARWAASEPVSRALHERLRTRESEAPAGEAPHRTGIVSRYRWRTRLRMLLPHTPPLYLLVPKGRDCGDHDWYRHEGNVWHCYHCRTVRDAAQG